ncbi:beta-Ala-His dipeptidase [Candidatus Poribacteria bacterium]|nr:beta-Ala-His dipeptidase [Candidatus Poribacteria bacterium]
MARSPLFDRPEFDPPLLWELFERLSSIPRASGCEERARDFVLGIAAEQGWETARDGAGNVVLRVPATPGRETAPPLVLQSHLDMVCIPREGVEHDFETEPLHLEVTDGDGGPVVRAAGTTLGADNGIGVAAALAAALLPDVVHGPLELLFTVEEETGMTGAEAIHAGLVRASQMLNLDSEEDHVLTIGCAGGIGHRMTWGFELEPPAEGAQFQAVHVHGLLGGHSGQDIHLGRGNAIKLLSEVLDEAAGPGFRLASIEGGTRHNAIPDRAKAVFTARTGIGSEPPRLANEMTERFRERLDGRDKGVAVEVHTLADTPAGVLGAEASGRLLDILREVPHGIRAMRPENPGEVHTSINMATVMSQRDGADRLVVHMEATTRSMEQDGLDSMHQRLQRLAERTGGQATIGFEFPPWQPVDGSSVTAAARQAHVRLFGREPQIMMAHAGLECAFIARALPGMDMVSLGPFISGAHTPDECVPAESVRKFWALLTALLDLLGTVAPTPAGQGTPAEATSSETSK